MKTLSIVIPVYNLWRMTAGCLASIFKSTFPKEQYEIIIVDNASDDMTPTLLDYLIEQGEPIKVFRNEKNLSYLLGANQGWKEVETPYVLHLNNDVLVDKDCIKTMVETFDYDPKIGIVGAIQYFPNGVRNPPLSWFYRGDEDVGNVYKTDITEEDLERPYIECDVAGGFGCAAVRKEVWEEVGYFDEQFAPCHYEQEDYCLRTKRAGWKVVLAPKACCIHFVAATTSFNLEYFNKILDRNRRIFRKKWGESLRRK